MKMTEAMRHQMHEDTKAALAASGETAKLLYLPVIQAAVTAMKECRAQGVERGDAVLGLIETFCSLLCAESADIKSPLEKAKTLSLLRRVMIEVFDSKASVAIFLDEKTIERNFTDLAERTKEH